MSTLVFRPRLIDALAGYDRQRFLADVGAGVTVAVVALPLAMAFAIASGLAPEAGLFTAIVGGFLISLLGGSRVQIGGPAGAFIVIVYGIVHDHGVAGLLVATVLSGALLFALGALRLGTLIHYIPTSVVIGFTNGIAVLIALSQVKDFLGLRIADMPADFFGIAGALWAHRSTLNPAALVLALASLAVVLGWKPTLAALVRRRPRLAKWLRPLGSLPGSIVALALAMIAVATLALPVETIGSRFGGIPSSLPTFAPPAFQWESVRALMMPAITLALLGAIESLLCARVADDRIGDRHDPNQELMAQGVANIAAPLLGGMPATGTIARTITSVEAGAVSPVAGMVHALMLLVVVLVAAPLAASIPLAALAAILMAVAWNMGQWRAFRHLPRMTIPYRFTLLAVFLLTVVFDLTVAVQVGILASVVVFIWRMARLTRIEPLDVAEFRAVPEEAQAWRVSGALFFGSTTVLQGLQDALPARVLVVDFSGVPYLDSTGAESITALARACRERHVHLLLCGFAPQPLDMARRSGVLVAGKDAPLADLAHAVEQARTLLETPFQPT